MEERLAAVALIALRLHLLVCGALLAAGALVPFAYETGDDAEQSFNLVTVFADFDGEGEGIAFAVGFAGLLLCTITAVMIVLMQWNGQLSPIARRIGKVVGVLMLIGALVPTLAALNSADIPRADPGFGMALYYPGAILFLYLMHSRSLDRLRTD